MKLNFLAIPIYLSTWSFIGTANASESLPIHRPTDVLTQTATTRLSGSVTTTNPFQEMFAQSTTPRKEKTSLLKSVRNKSKSLANFVFDLRGFDWSKEGADVIADSDPNLKNDLAREYKNQKLHDIEELQKTTLLMQIALYADRNLAKTLEAIKALEDLVGRDEARRLTTEIQQTKFSYETMPPSTSTLDFEKRQILVGKILEASAKQDCIVQDVSSRLAKYNHRSKAMRTTAKVVYSSLGVATFTPTLVAPIAEAALLSFMMATGGPEQDKLLKEIYLGKMLESRCHLINEKAHLLVEGIDQATTTQNPRLLACSQLLLRQLANDEELCRYAFSDSDRSSAE